ncbi:hypothetical protein C1645_834702 [Glomus cerebriforme]|uniref:Uncharacterized protein n=1 Tax=Glomus cerebriforme TaxID=658196 RepID=A0A397SDA2_9GLOM|nr:hypothetical protein C1645_834702 [Glomus cerebriforme]
MEGIQELLSNPNIVNSEFYVDFKIHKNANGQRYYSELYNSTWWEKCEKNIPMGAKVLAIIVYSDSTNCDQLGRKSEHPLSITFGNISGWRRQKLDAQRENLNNMQLYNNQIILQFTCALFMEDLGSIAVRQIDERLAAIPRFQRLTQFPEGLKTLKFYTADHYRTLMKVMVFVIEGLHAEKNDQLVDFNIAIYMNESEHNQYLTDEGYCYEPLALALIQCLQEFIFIPIESIQEVVHIIP